MFVNGPNEPAAERSSCTRNRRRGLTPVMLLAAGAIGAAVLMTAAILSTGSPEDPAVCSSTDLALPDNIDPIHRAMVNSLWNMTPASRRPVAACFAPGTDPAVMEAIDAALYQPGLRYQLGSRWSETAYDGPNSGQGNPTTLSYSFVPDGTFIPSGVGEASGPSVLFDRFDTLFAGDTAAWQNRFHQCFARWSELTGITYVYEPSDDGADMFDAPGVPGVRGDCRISSKNIDGASSILAYNFFPDTGDMVLDSSENWAMGPLNQNRFLRNVVAHEHGHGMGLQHVCPANATKLMEPFISTAYDGPQHDDIRGGQRGYGDANEHNDSVGTATPLGLIDGALSVSNVGMDDNNESDYYSFDAAAGKQVNIDLVPIGAQYLAGPQTSACDTGGLVNSLITNNLDVELIDEDGVTVLGSANSQPAGVTERICEVQLGAGGTFYVRVISGNADDVQLYRLDVTVEDSSGAGAFTISFPNGTPSEVAPAGGTQVLVRTTNGTGAADTASGLLHYSIDGGAFSTVALSHVGSNGSGDDFLATFPAAPCLSEITWYVTIDVIGGGTIQQPPACPGVLLTSTASGALQTVFADNFQTNMGWTVTNSGLTDGPWERAIPAGGGVRGDPPTDFDGSGFCYVTDNAVGNSDVDGGSTTLTSPVIDLSAFDDARVNYARWYRNDFGASPGTDTWLVQITSDGVNWVNLENTMQSTSAWVEQSFRVGQFVAPSATVRVRFIASDPDPGAVVEAGVDAFEVIGATCAADSDGDEVPDEIDNCPFFFNPEQADPDLDGLGTGCDNCPNTSNVDQADNDADGLGNVCDNCPNDPNVGQEDNDADGIGNVCDNCPDNLNPGQEDLDMDGAGDACDCDADGDGAQSAGCAGPDCDDLDPAVSPDAAEVCDDGIDNDCDGDIDVADSDCAAPDCCGDLDGSGVIDLTDFATLAVCFGDTKPTGCSPQEFDCADLDGSGGVDLADFATFAVNFGGAPNCNP